MYKSGHIGASLLVYAPLGFVTAVIGGPQMAVLGGVVAVVLATVPDLDLRTPFIKHRGPTHTAWFAGCVAVLGGIAGFAFGLQIGILAAFGFAALTALTAGLAIASHIAADALTPMGVRPFAPWSARHYTWGVVKAANPVANVVLLGVGGAAAAGLTYLGIMVHSLF